MRGPPLNRNLPRTCSVTGRRRAPTRVDGDVMMLYWGEVEAGEVKVRRSVGSSQ